MPSPTQADRLAHEVLTRRLSLRPGENVTIEAYPEALPWATGFVREARRRGARPLLHFEDEASYWSAVREGGARLLGSPGDHEWAALAATDVYIYFWGPEDLARRARLPDAVQEQLTAFNGRWYETARRAKLRGARMMIARATEANARFWGVPLGAWRREVLAASLRDPKHLRKPAVAVERALARGHELRLRHPNGTDLTLRLAGRDPVVATGEVRPAARASRFGRMANVPDGSVYVAVDESTADGTVVANLPTTTAAYRLTGGRFRFRAGRLVEATFRDGGSAFRREYRAAGPGRERPAFVEVGLDPEVRRAPGLEEIVAGAVTVGVGGNAGFGGRTKVDFLGYLSVAGAELSVDGRTVARNGTVGRP